MDENNRNLNNENPDNQGENKDKGYTPPYQNQGGGEYPPIQPRISTEPPKEDYSWDYNKYETITNEPKKKPKKNIGLIVFLLILIFCLLIGLGAITMVSYNQANQLKNRNTIAPPATTSEEEAKDPSEPSGGEAVSEKTKPAGSRLTTPEVAAKVSPSVVGILRYESSLYEATGLGSGIIVKEDGEYTYVVTNAHVVQYGTRFKVRLHDTSDYDAELVGADSDSDIAMLKIRTTGLTVAEIGNSNDLEVGETVIAIGNPVTIDLSGSVTRGIVSALDRNLHTGTSVNYIQTDAAINPGNSGGALVNEYGQVIGINTMKVQGSGFEGLGFAIPMNDAVPVMEELMEFGKVASRPVLGITGMEINEEVAYSQDIPMGIMVVSVSRNAKFEVMPKEGDIITQLDGERITGLSDLKQLLREYKIGDEVTLTMVRQLASGAQEEYTTVVELIAVED